jgi:lipoprotein NlpI
MNVNTVGMLAQLNQVSQQVDSNLWSRFISEHGILYDYVGLHGFA